MIYECEVDGYQTEELNVIIAYCWEKYPELCEKSDNLDGLFLTREE